MTDDLVKRLKRLIVEITDPEKHQYRWSDEFIAMKIEKAVDRIEALEEVIKESRKEIEWWALEHGCCAGREIDTLEKIDAVLAGEKKDG